MKKSRTARKSFLSKQLVIQIERIAETELLAKSISQPGGVPRTELVESTSEPGGLPRTELSESTSEPQVLAGPKTAPETSDMAFRSPLRGGNRGRGRGWGNSNQEQFYGHNRFNNSNQNWDRGRGRGNWNSEHHYGYQVCNGSAEQYSGYQHDLRNSLNRKGRSRDKDTRYESERMPNNARGSPREYSNRREDSSYDRHDKRLKSDDKRHSTERYTSSTRRDYRKRSRSPRSRRRSRSPHHSSRSEHSGSSSRSSHTSVDYKELSPKKRKLSPNRGEDRDIKKNEPDFETVSDNTMSGSSDYDTPHKQTTPKSKPYPKSVRKDENSPVSRSHKIETVKKRKFFETKKYTSPIKPGLNWSDGISSDKRHLRELSEPENRPCPSSENEEITHSDICDYETGNENSRTSTPYVWLKRVDIVDTYNKTSNNDMKSDCDREYSCGGVIKMNESSQHIAICGNKLGDMNGNSDYEIDIQSVSNTELLKHDSSELSSCCTDKMQLQPSFTHSGSKSSNSSEKDNVTESTLFKRRSSIDRATTEELKNQKLNVPELNDHERKSETVENREKGRDCSKAVNSYGPERNKIDNAVQLRNTTIEPTRYIKTNDVKRTKQTIDNVTSNVGTSEENISKLLENLRHAEKNAPETKSIVSTLSAHLNKFISKGPKKSSTESTSRTSSVKNPSSKLKRSSSFVETCISEGSKEQPMITGMEYASATLKPASASRARRQSAPTRIDSNNDHNSNSEKHNGKKVTTGLKSDTKKILPDTDLKSNCEQYVGDSPAEPNGTAASSTPKKAFTSKDGKNQDMNISKPSIESTHDSIESTHDSKMNELSKKNRHHSENMSNKKSTQISDVCKTSAHNEKKRKLSELDDQYGTVSSKTHKHGIEGSVLGPNKWRSSEPREQYCAKYDKIKSEKSKEKIRHSSENVSSGNKTHTTFDTAPRKPKNIDTEKNRTFNETQKMKSASVSDVNSDRLTRNVRQSSENMNTKNEGTERVNGVYKQFNETSGKEQAGPTKEIEKKARHKSGNISDNQIRKHSDTITIKQSSVDIRLNKQTSEAPMKEQVESKKEQYAHEWKTRNSSDTLSTDNHSSAIQGDTARDNEHLIGTLNEVNSESGKGTNVDICKSKVKERSEHILLEDDTNSNIKQGDASVHLKEDWQMTGMCHQVQAKPTNESTFDTLREPDALSKRSEDRTDSSSSTQRNRRLSETHGQERSKYDLGNKVDVLKKPMKHVNGDTASNQGPMIHSGKQIKECDQMKNDSYERLQDKSEKESKIDKLRRHKWGEFIALGQSKVISTSTKVSQSTNAASEKSVATRDRELIDSVNECSNVTSTKKSNLFNVFEKNVETEDKINEEVAEKEALGDTIKCTKEVEKGERTGVCQKKRLFNKNAPRVSLLNKLSPVKGTNKSLLSNYIFPKKLSSKSPVKRGPLHMKKTLKNAPSAQLLNSNVKKSQIGGSDKKYVKGPTKDRNIFEKLSSNRVDREDKIMSVKEKESETADVNDISQKEVPINPKDLLLNEKQNNLSRPNETGKEYGEEKVTSHALKESQMRLAIKKTKEVNTTGTVDMSSSKDNSKAFVLTTDSNADEHCLQCVVQSTEYLPINSEMSKEKCTRQQDKPVNKQGHISKSNQNETYDSLEEPKNGVGSHLNLPGSIPANDSSNRMKPTDVEKPRSMSLIDPGKEESDLDNTNLRDIHAGNQESMDACQPRNSQPYEGDEISNVFQDNSILSELSQQKQAARSTNPVSELQIGVQESYTIPDIHNADFDSEDETDDDILPIDINMHTPAPESPMFTARKVENEDTYVARELHFGSVENKDFTDNSDCKDNLDISANQHETVALPGNTELDKTVIEVKCEDKKDILASPGPFSKGICKTSQRTPQRFSERVIDVSAFSDNEDDLDILSNVDHKEIKELIIPERVSNLDDVDLTLSDEELEKSSVDITPTRNKQKQDLSTTSPELNPGKWMEKAKQSRLKLPKKRNMESKSVGDLITRTTERKRRVSDNDVDIASCVPKMPDNVNELSPNMVFKNGFPVKHRKVLKDSADEHTFAHLDPKRLYDKDVRGKCLHCDGCQMYFTPLSFSVHHHTSSVLQQLDYDKSIEAEFEVVNPSLIFWNHLAETIFTDFQTFCQELKRGHRPPEPPEPNDLLKTLLNPKVDGKAVIKDIATGTHAEISAHQSVSGEQTHRQVAATNSGNKHSNIPQNTENLQKLHQSHVDQHVLCQQQIPTNKCSVQMQLKGRVGDLSSYPGLPETNHGVPTASSLIHGSAAQTSSSMQTSSSHQDSTYNVRLPRNSVLLNERMSSHVSRERRVSSGQPEHHGTAGHQSVQPPGYFGLHLLNDQPDHHVRPQEKNKYGVERSDWQTNTFIDQNHTMSDSTNIPGRPHQGHMVTAASSPQFDNGQQLLHDNPLAGKLKQGATMPPLMNTLTASLLLLRPVVYPPHSTDRATDQDNTTSMNFPISKTCVHHIQNESDLYSTSGIRTECISPALEDIENTRGGGDIERKVKNPSKTLSFTALQFAGLTAKGKDGLESTKTVPSMPPISHQSTTFNINEPPVSTEVKEVTLRIPECTKVNRRETVQNSTSNIPPKPDGTEAVGADSRVSDTVRDENDSPTAVTSTRRTGSARTTPSTVQETTVRAKIENGLKGLCQLMNINSPDEGLNLLFLARKIHMLGLGRIDEAVARAELKERAQEQIRSLEVRVELLEQQAQDKNSS